MSSHATLHHLSRWPLEPFTVAKQLRNFQYKQISPCELRLTVLPCGYSIRYFSHMTESVFAFMLDSGFDATAYSLTGNCSTMSYINLLRCADSVASYSFGIQNTTHHVLFVLRTTQSSFAVNVLILLPIHQTLKLHTSPRVQPLGQIHYPFSYQLTGLV